MADSAVQIWCLLASLVLFLEQPRYHGNPEAHTDHSKTVPSIARFSNTTAPADQDYDLTPDSEAIVAELCDFVVVYLL